MKMTAREAALLSSARVSRYKIHNEEEETVLMKYGSSSEVENYIIKQLIVYYDELENNALTALIERGDRHLLLQYAKKYHITGKEHIDKIMSIYDDDTIEEVTKLCMGYAANYFRLGLLRAKKYSLCVKIYDIILENNLSDVLPQHEATVLAMAIKIYNNGGILYNDLDKDTEMESIFFAHAENSMVKGYIKRRFDNDVECAETESLRGLLKRHDMSLVKEYMKYCPLNLNDWEILLQEYNDDEVVEFSHHSGLNLDKAILKAERYKLYQRIYG